MVGRPRVPRYEDKTDQYLFGHKVLPSILFKQPEIVAELLKPNAAEFLTALWDEYAAEWGIAGGDHTVKVKWFASSDGALAVLIDLPVPHMVPEPHGAVLLVRPVRAYFPLELASETDVRSYERASWYRLSSQPEREAQQRRPGYVGEWTADGAHRNHGFLILDVKKILLAVSHIVGVVDDWKVITNEEAQRTFPSDLSSISVRVPEVPLPPAIARELGDQVQSILKGALDDRSKREAGKAIADLVRQYRQQYGDASAEITLHTKHVVRLFLECGDYTKAYDIASEWGRFCLSERGTRAPETHIAYTWLARVLRADPRLPEEERIKRSDIRIRMRNRLPGGIRKDLPGADSLEE